MSEQSPTGRRAAPPRGVLLPLMLAQFICSFAGSNMNVMINDISEDLDTTVAGVQTAITIFLLVMAALMIPGGKLTDRYGRKVCLNAGLALFGLGALISAVSPGLPMLIVGNSILEGIGTALLIPPVYILTTLLFTEITTRARAFGAINGMGGVGSATGPLIGGLIATLLTWRAAFVFQALVIVLIVVLSRRVLHDPLPPDRTLKFDTVGAVLSSVALVLIVTGILAADDNWWLTLALIVAGSLMLALFFRWVHTRERAGHEVLLSTSLFRNRASNLGLITQNIQWLVLMGISFVVSAFLQVVRGYNAIQTGLVITAATVGLLLSSFAAERMAKRRSQRALIMSGFAVTIAGIVLFLILAGLSTAVWAFLPGLFLIGVGIGAMLTPSVNLVQSSFPDELQGEISGLSRSVSNLGSSLGAAIAGTIMVVQLGSRPGSSYAAALVVLAVIAAGGLVAAAFLPGGRPANAPAAGPQVPSAPVR
ncbi:MFS transporter [Jidongwangia harbinensis]|uniref:MFS transporter n=1 Tax=Jidongwangia harbinensis TaxID=2878561 RepID=UPI001CDA3C54|nr:MFS transporter [Jidongwangia harbinensis]MCA2216487.1 MFS transporter [Jidongwangia harbinensis]